MTMNEVCLCSFSILLASEEFGASQRAAKMRPKLGSRKRPMANILLGRETQV